MQDFLLLVVTAAAVAIGWRVMGRLDRFMERKKKNDADRWLY